MTSICKLNINANFKKLLTAVLQDGSTKLKLTLTTILIMEFTNCNANIPQKINWFSVQLAALKFSQLVLKVVIIILVFHNQ